MKPKFSSTEMFCLLACAAGLWLALLLPEVQQSATHHHFADQRMYGGLPCTLDVLSNLPFAVLGVLGLLNLAPAHRVHRAQWGSAVLFFAGLVATAVGSAVYHLQPDDAGLVLDRLGMVLAFAGLLGLAASDRVSDRAGWALGGAVLLLGPISVLVWRNSGNVLPWAVLQFGGMALVLGLALLRPAPGALGLRLGVVMLVYGSAKLFELADHAIFELTQHLVSGHSLKHVVASLAALPVIGAMRLRTAHSGQNPAHVPQTRSGAPSPWRNA